MSESESSQRDQVETASDESRPQPVPSGKGDPGRPGMSGISRRAFLSAIGAAGGTGALLPAMDAWGLGIQSHQSQPPELTGDPNGTSVIILGAGVAGMTAAYEMANRGYNVTILEARDFAGGRCQTGRRGVTLKEDGQPTQVCNFDEGQYVNHGPWRIPYHHTSVLHYTNEFNIPLEFFNNDNDAAYVYRENGNGPLAGQRLRKKEVKADMAGYSNEILAKALRQDVLDAEMTSRDKEALVDFLVTHGGLNSDTLNYNGTSGRGYASDPGAGLQPGESSSPFDFSELLRSGAWDFYEAVPSYSQQVFMFQPVGGMDRIAQGFEQAVGRLIHYSHEVREIRQNEDGVQIAYHDRRSGQSGTMEAAYCICALPLSVLRRVDADFSQEFRDAMDQVSYVATGKIGLQFSRRFWETDDHIYGGHSSIDVSEINWLSYPNYNWQGQKGVIQGYYNFGSTAVQVSQMSPNERAEMALRHGQKLHPTYRDDFETAFSVAWHLVPYSYGGWASWSEEARQQAYPRLNEPDGRVYLAGEHLSYLTGWQAGAIESAWLQIEKIHQRVMNG